MKYPPKITSIILLISFSVSSITQANPLDIRKQSCLRPLSASEGTASDIESGLNKPAPEIIFGTSGWRDIIDENFNERNVALVAQATADCIIEDGLADTPYIVGHDTRKKGNIFSMITAAVLAENGINIMFCDGYTPSPVIAYTIVSRKLRGGMNITASHNPKEYQGFKFTPSHGGPAPTVTIDWIQERANYYMHHPERAKALGVLANYKEVFKALLQDGKIIKIDPAESYINYLYNLDIIDFDLIKNSPYMVAADPSHGTSGRYYETVYGEGGLNKLVKLIHGGPRADFGALKRPEPNRENLEQLARFIRNNSTAKRPILGAAADGDADRVGIVDINGRFIESNELAAIFYWYLHKIKGLKGGVAKNVATTNMLNGLAGFFGEECYETQVGVKNFVEFVLDGRAIVAAESSAHIVLNTESWDDAVLCSLLALQILADKDTIRKKTGKTFKNLTDILNYIRRDIIGKYFRFNEIAILADEDKKALLVDMNQNPNAVRKKLTESELSTLLSANNLQISQISTLPKNGIKIVFGDGSWICLRPSGTEPLIRFYAEGVADSPQAAQNKISALENIAKRLIGIEDKKNPHIKILSLPDVNEGEKNKFKKALQSLLDRKTFVQKTFKRLFNIDVNPSDISEFAIEYINQGGLNYIYRVKATMKNGKIFVFTIRQNNGIDYQGERGHAVDVYCGECQRPLSDKMLRYITKFGTHATVNGIFFVSQEYILGRDLESILDDNSVSKKTKRQLAKKAYRTYADFANATHYIIRDPCPANIMLLSDNTMKIVDICRLLPASPHTGGLSKLEFKLIVYGYFRKYLEGDVEIEKELRQAPRVKLIRTKAPAGRRTFVSIGFKGMRRAPKAKFYAGSETKKANVLLKLVEDVAKIIKEDDLDIAIGWERSVSPQLLFQFYLDRNITYPVFSESKENSAGFRTQTLLVNPDILQFIEDKDYRNLIIVLFLYELMRLNYLDDEKVLHHILPIIYKHPDLLRSIQNVIAKGKTYGLSGEEWLNYIGSWTVPARNLAQPISMTSDRAVIEEYIAVSA